VYGKIQNINKAATTASPVRTITYAYVYDAYGNRISKIVDKLGVATDDYTWYVRDASGNVMAVYSYTGANTTSGVLNVTEQHLYGSSRLGILNTTINADAAIAAVNANLVGPTYLSNFIRGNKYYEFGNHLSNVLVSVSDKKIEHNAGNGTIDYYNADVVSANDYAPFGMQMVGRTFTGAGTYRYGFNGKENDNEVKGEGNQQDYGMRIYDPRLGRFLSVDPLQVKYPELTPYQFASNSPIDGVDEDGLEWAPTKDKAGNTTNYNWAGYNSDGTAKKGTVASAVLNKGDYNYLFTSNQKNQTGTLDIMTTKHAPTSYPQGNDNSTQYNYTVNFQQYAINPIYQYTNVTASLWNVSEKQSLFSGANSQVNNYV
jgi:RHS repeat-associated protein